MRLSQHEVDSFISVFNEYLSSSEYQAHLYGSRVDDSLHGGDIDMLWIVPEDKVKPLNMEKHRILVKIKNLIGEQKIDLSIISEAESINDPFYSIAMEKTVLIAQK